MFVVQLPSGSTLGARAPCRQQQPAGLVQGQCPWRGHREGWHGGLRVPLPHGWAMDMEKSRPSDQHQSEHLQISPAELLQIARVTLVEKSPFERQFATS